MSPYTRACVQLTGFHVGVPADRAVPQRKRWGGAADATGWLGLLVPQIPNRHLRAKTSSYPLHSEGSACNKPLVPSPVCTSAAVCHPWSHKPQGICIVQTKKPWIDCLQNPPIAKANIMAFWDCHRGVQLDRLGTVGQHAKSEDKVVASAR